MKRIFSVLLTGCLLLGSVAAAHAEGGFFDSDKPSAVLGAPVNLSIGGGAILPKGMLLTALNTSFRDKTQHVGPDGAANDTFSQTWLLKIRYGLFDRFEISAVVPYVNNDVDNQYWRVEGLGDVYVGTATAILSQRAGDPMWLTLLAGLNLPTGDEHIPGAGVLGGRLGLSWAKRFNKNILVAGDLVWEMPLGRGNEPYDSPAAWNRSGSVERGDVYTATAHARYMFNSWDVGVETVYQKAESGTRHLGDNYVRPADGKSEFIMNNGVTEWVVGPSVNYAFDSLSLWVGAGAFLPVYQDAKGPAKMEDVRYEFKIGKTW